MNDRFEVVFIWIWEMIGVVGCLGVVALSVIVGLWLIYDVVSRLLFGGLL